MMRLDIQSKCIDYDGLLSKISQSVYFEVQKILQQEKNSLAQTSSKTNNTCCAKMRSLNWISEIWSNWIQWAGLHFSSVLLHCTVMEIGNALLWFVMQHRMQAVVKYFAKYIVFFSSFFLHFNRLDRIVLPDRAVSSGRISIVSAITRSGMPPLCIIHPLTPTFSSQYNAIYNQCIMHYTSVDSNFFIAIQCIMYYTSADSNFFIIIQCIMYYTSADSNIFIAIQCTLQSMHYGLYVRWVNLFWGQSLCIKHLMT